MKERKRKEQEKDKKSVERGTKKEQKRIYCCFQQASKKIMKFFVSW
jgi:hypothetical protein